MSIFRISLGCLLGITVAATSTFGHMAHAVTFGDTVEGSITFLTPCQNNTVLSLAVAVDVSSRIYVNGVATFYDNGDTTYNNGSYQVILRDSDDTTTLAAIQLTSFTEPAIATNTLVTSGVLFQGAAGTSAYTAPPGNYLLKFIVFPGGSCSGSGPIVKSPTLTYILLSSALDRIYANGFNAMVFEENHRAMTV